jgi:medium-chain acyl-[acyl-carrier-protein] hydrolase
LTESPAKVNSWISRRNPNLHAKQRLICVPYAGGGTAVFSEWPQKLGKDVEVCCLQLPGRETRFREKPFELMSELVPAAAEGIRDFLDKEFSLYGHSLGALIAFELVRYFRRHFGSEPANLIVSAARAPQLPYPFLSIGKLPQREFISEVGKRYEPISPELLADADMLQATLPILRADFAVFETYAYRDEPPLTANIHVFGGESDRTVSHEALLAWQAQTSGAHSVTMIPGGHFFIRDQRHRVLEFIRSLLCPPNPLGLEESFKS